MLAELGFHIIGEQVELTRERICLRKSDDKLGGIGYSGCALLETDFHVLEAGSAGQL